MTAQPWRAAGLLGERGAACHEAIEVMTSDTEREDGGVVFIGPAEDVALALDILHEPAQMEGDCELNFLGWACDQVADGLHEGGPLLLGGMQSAVGEGVRNAGAPEDERVRVAQFVSFVEQNDALGGDVGASGFAVKFRGVVLEFVECSRDCFVLKFGGGVGDIEHDEQRIGVCGFFERRLEGGDEVVGEVADEANGVGEHDIDGAIDFPFAGAGHECGKELVVGVRATCGEGVEERALAGVGVANEANCEVLGIA